MSCAQGHTSHHSHAHGHGTGSTARLFWALLFIAGFAAVEVAGGLISGSLALLADAGHMIADAAALALALSAQWIAKRPESERFPFGMKRAQVLAAFVNGLALIVIVAFLFWEALGRFGNPEPINASIMLAVAATGLAANIAAFAILHPTAEHNVNVRGAMLHVMADLFGSVAAILSAFVIMATGFMTIDAILTVLVCGLILRSALPLVRETASILMQAAPPDFDTEAVRAHLLASSEIFDVHHVRAWCLTPEEPMVALHAVICPDCDQKAVLQRIKKTLADDFGIHQSTVQLETAPESDADHQWAGCPDVLRAAE